MGHLFLRSLGDKCERRIFSCSPIFKEASIIWGIRVLTSNVLNKSNIICAAGIWRINVSDEHFLLRGRVVFGDVFLCIPNIAQFSFARKKNRKTNRQTIQIKLKEKKEKKKKRKKKKDKRKKG